MTVTILVGDEKKFETEPLLIEIPELSIYKFG